MSWEGPAEYRSGALELLERLTQTLIDEKIKELIAAVSNSQPESQQALDELTDDELLAIATWTGNAASRITDECRRRGELGRRFAAYLDQPTVGDLLRRLLET